MTKEVWEKREEGAKMLVEYVKTLDYTTDYRHEERTKKERTRNHEGNRK
jgi:hypothetical protein